MRNPRNRRHRGIPRPRVLLRLALVVGVVCAVTLPAQPAAAATGGTVSGTVTASGGGAALSGCVSAFDEANPDAIAAIGCVDGAGAYSLSLPAGQYRLLFSGFVNASASPLSDEWNGDKATYEQSSALTVGSGGSYVVNAALASGTPLEFDFYDTLHSSWTASANQGCVWAYTTENEFASYDCVGSCDSLVHCPPGGYLQVLLHRLRRNARWSLVPRPVVGSGLRHRPTDVDD